MGVVGKFYACSATQTSFRRIKLNDFIISSFSCQLTCLYHCLYLTLQLPPFFPNQGSPLEQARNKWSQYRYRKESGMHKYSASPPFKLACVDLPSYPSQAFDLSFLASFHLHFISAAFCLSVICPILQFIKAKGIWNEMLSFYFVTLGIKQMFWKYMICLSTKLPAPPC